MEAIEYEVEVCGPEGYVKLTAESKSHAKELISTLIGATEQYHSISIEEA